jgi:hypothetical protein
MYRSYRLLDISQYGQEFTTVKPGYCGHRYINAIDIKGKRVVSFAFLHIGICFCHFRYKSMLQQQLTFALIKEIYHLSFIQSVFQDCILNIIMPFHKEPATSAHAKMIDIAVTFHGRIRTKTTWTRTWIARLQNQDTNCITMISTSTQKSIFITYMYFKVLQDQS